MYRLSGRSDICIEKEKHKIWCIFLFFSLLVSQTRFIFRFLATLRLPGGAFGPGRGRLGKAVCLGPISVLSRHPGGCASPLSGVQTNTMYRLFADTLLVGKHGSDAAQSRSCSGRALCSAAPPRVKKGGKKRKSERSQQAVSFF